MDDEKILGCLNIIEKSIKECPNQDAGHWILCQCQQSLDYAKSLLTNQKSVWETINNHLGTSLTESDYEGWLEGDSENYDEFEKAVKRILTPQEVERGEQAARFVALLQYKLGVGGRYAGGIDLKLLLDNV